MKKILLIVLGTLYSIHAKEPSITKQNQCTTSTKMVEIKKQIPSIEIHLPYATTNNFTKKPIYSSTKCCALQCVVDALKKVQAELAEQNLGLLIWDAYRPLSVQKIFWEIVPDQRYVMPPDKGSRHNRGAAIDCTLINLKTKKQLPMPSEFDDFSVRAHRNYMGASPEQIKKRQLLEDVMHKHGFKGVRCEWWHFDYKGWEQFPILDIPLEELP